MDPAERQALHNVKEELQNCAVITDKMLVHLLQNQKITKAEKYELSVSIILSHFLILEILMIFFSFCQPIICKLWNNICL